MRRPKRDEIRAGLWTLRAVGRCRRELGTRDLEDVRLPPSGHISSEARWVVSQLLRRRRDQCLSDALILQAWRTDHGDPVAVVIGVSSPSSGFSAHAWLEDSVDAQSEEHQPIHRLAPRTARSSAE